ncbi:flagellar export protein FliJ [Pseudohongiella acticola]|uniref:Flagellar FliJ protein n=1 Tax=Pseudohongiella acticola TaxID=1524254 RepID=A0A1E8CI38_9GAMM|nr:flagellar export protein FliJ [Pseudohongiella acticola]OFE12039.1 flagellar export protein FliJ [Pseudohongiella acticola]
MNRVKRMQPVLRLAELEADKAGRALTMLQQRIQAEETKLSQLYAYQQDYRNQMQLSGQAGMTVERLRLFDGFHQQLDRAISHQRDLINHMQQDQERVREHWRQLDIRHKSLEKMIERLKRDADVQQARNEQRNHDEFSRRRASDSGWS